MAETNVEQWKAWNGADGDFWVRRADRLDAGIANYMEPFLAAAAIQPSDTVLDIGCGTGTTTRQAAERGGEVLGVDLSAQMIELARQRSEGVAGLRYEQADAQTHEFAEAAYDVAISRNGSMFFEDPVAAFGNIRRALKPGGRLVLLAWQPLDDNAWISTFRTIMAAGRDLPEPQPGGVHAFSLSDPDRVKALLTEAGFAEVRLTGLNETMYFGQDPHDAAEFISSQFEKMIEPADRDSVRTELEADMAVHMTERGVEYDSAAWLIEAA
ncbi:SAM-dependent methyltransferase [Actinosynnema sp. ALI-1.44]|uniref:class I SAM-dependent methyltransferase n=1 Tax=Actinosynnema sp. ALI-1.44 TaxID=1933779 RepID=UPI00097BD9C2|nr:class I SAM-dependent methyltransferase [Actinosynnema sp. ALI-1.44]ONI70802.1 SAM-dependent methyltransferase [Actinosynnema sp. ALI-1.44]